VAGRPKIDKFTLHSSAASLDQSLSSLGWTPRLKHFGQVSPCDPDECSVEAVKAALGGDIYFHFAGAKWFYLVVPDIAWGDNRYNFLALPSPKNRINKSQHWGADFHLFFVGEKLRRIFGKKLPHTVVALGRLTTETKTLRRLSFKSIEAIN
jgi:hypothetical protein